MQYIVHLLIFVSIYVMLAQSLSLSVGFGGMVSLAHAGFFGIGAYSAAILSTQYGMSVLLIMPIAMAICAIMAAVVAVIAFRTVEDYFIICTMGIQIIVFSIMNNWVSITNGPLGISGIPAIELSGMSIDSNYSFFLVCLMSSSAVFFILKRLTGTAFGRTLKIISEDEIFALSLGKNVYVTKLLAFTISGVLAAIPGVLYAYYVSYVNPSGFTVNESIFIFSIVTIAGMRNLEGCLFSAAFLVLLPELLRYLGISTVVAGNLRQMIYGIMMVLLIFRSIKKKKGCV